MYLKDGKKTTRPKETACKMTRLVVEIVEKVVAKQGMKVLKFLVFRKEKVLLTCIDLLVGMDGYDSEEEIESDYIPNLESAQEILDDESYFDSNDNIESYSKYKSEEY